MANQEHIRRQVESVRGEARSLISRYRAERLAKFAIASPPSKPETQASEAAVPVREAPMAPSAQTEPSLFSASPNIDRFLADHLKSVLGTEPAPAKKAEPAAAPPMAPAQPMSAPAAASPKTSPDALRAQQAESQIKHRLKSDAGIRLGLEPVFVVPAATQRAPAAKSRADGAGSSAAARPSNPRDQGQAIGLEPIVERTPKVSPEPKTDAPAASVQSGELPLSTILAIGPALSLRLKELGILSLHDLAAADEVALRTRLGAIGALVRVDAWIAEAKQYVATASGAGV